MVDLNHGVGEDLWELLHLEGWWALVRLRELELHKGITFRGHTREMGGHERGGGLVVEIGPVVSTNM